MSADELAKKILEAMKEPQDSASFSKGINVGEKKLLSLISKPSDAAERKPMLKLPTGTFIDKLFLDEKHEPLGGVPFGGQFGVLGLADAGKSILVEEIAIYLAHSGTKVMFIISEDIFHSDTSRFDLESRLRQKAEILKLDWNKIKENLLVLDTVKFAELRDWSTLIEVYRYAVEVLKITVTVVDSLTLLEEYRGAIKNRLLDLIRYNQNKGITAFFVCQRSEDEWDSYKIAGGIGVAHNLDCTIMVDFGKAWNYEVKTDTGKKQGEFVRICRILGNRLGDFDRHYHEVTITTDGFLRLKEEI
jgi:KaiC/GvpD/RAD55 family RecA-like ATPase